MKKKKFTGQLEQHAKEFQKLQISLEKRKSQQESIQEQLQNQLEEPIFAWLCEEIQQKLKADSGLQQDQSSKAVHHQREGQEVSLLLQQGKKASEWLKQQQDILKQKQKDLTALLEQRKLLETQINNLKKHPKLL